MAHPANRRIWQRLYAIMLGAAMAVWAFPALWPLETARANPFPDNVDEYNDGACPGPVVGQGGIDSDNPFLSLAVHPLDPDTVVVGSEGNGVFRSFDGGATWAWLRKGIYYSVDPVEGWCAYPEHYEIIFDRLEPNRLYAATTGWFYYSLDSGDNWARVKTGLHNPYLNAVAQDPHTPETLYLTPSNDVYNLNGPGLYISRDRGLSWQGAALPKDDNKTRPVLAAPGPPTVLYVAGYHPEASAEPLSSRHLGFARSDDGGASWALINQGLPSLAFPFISLDPSNPMVLYASVFGPEGGYAFRSNDQGRSWERFPQNNSINNLWRVRVSPHDPNILIGACLQGACTSLDQGISWSKSASVSPTEIEFTSDPDIVYLSTDGLLVFRSSDGGISFNQVGNMREVMGH